MPAIEKNPLLSELETLKLKMEELYTESFGDNASSESSAWAPPVSWEPLTDVWESSREWLVVLDLPGVSKEDLHVEVKDNRLNVWGKRPCPHVSERYESARIERPNGTFARAMDLPRDIDSESINAEFKEGVLTIRIPRNSHSRSAPQRIQVHRA